MHDPRRNPRVVGIGASAGAMDPLKEFFTEIGSDTGLAFVVVQHLILTTSATCRKFWRAKQG